ncbi:unnamed protein product [Caenorhabditis brenneri]
MSLSRPARFPLLKLPWLCIKDVVKSWDIFDIIFFALTSKKTRQIVKSFKIPLNEIEIFVLEQKWIKLGSSFKTWYFKSTGLESLSEQYSRKVPLVPGKNTIPWYTRITDRSLNSYTNGNEVTALKIAMEFLNEVFKCSVKTVSIEDSDFPESFGVKSTVNFFVQYQNPQLFGHARNQKLNSLLENLEVTGTCHFWMRDTENVLYCDPKLFKCKKLMFFSGSGGWVTREILMQFEVAQLNFYSCPFSAEDILSFVTNWFHSYNKKLEYLYIPFQLRNLSLETFRTAELNPLPFSERNRVPTSQSFTKIDFSEGLEIVREDDSQATIHVKEGYFLFYVWNNQSAITQH